MNKIELRKKILNQRTNMDEKVSNELSEKICQKFLMTDMYKNASEIFAYSAIQNEVSCSKIIETALKDGKKVALPKVFTDSEDNLMEFYYITSDSCIQKGFMGIAEPSDTSDLAVPGKDSLIITPGIVFDGNFRRIGFGKGFYDRYFARYSPDALKIAVCYDFQLFEEIPADIYDIPVDGIITQNIELFR